MPTVDNITGNIRLYPAKMKFQSPRVTEDWHQGGKDWHQGV